MTTIITASFFKQPFPTACSLTFDRLRSRVMASYRDPRECFAPLEVIERLLEIRAELGFSENLYLDRSQQLTDFLDAYGFDAYAIKTGNEKIDLDDNSTPVVPGGEILHLSVTAH
jgi:hypothetical protein